jgi:hypothetical protein
VASRETDEYLDPILDDLFALMQLGLVEVKGVNENGDYVYGLTQKGESIDIQEAFDMINDSFEEGM